MPMYRIPATGEHFEQPTPYAAPPGLAQFYAVRVRRSPQRAHSASTAIARPVSVQARRSRLAESMHQSQAAPAGPAPVHAMTLDEFLDPAQHHDVVSLASPTAAPPLSATFRKRLRRKGDGSTKAIAFYTIGDTTKSAYWREYAEAFVRGKGGLVFGVRTQAEAAARLNEVRNADVREVYFVGHGVAPGPNGGGLQQPAYMLSGKSNGNHFSAATYAQLVTPSMGPLVRALAPLLSLDHQVVVRFLACHCGVGKKLQTGIARSLSKLAPGVDVLVTGYSGNYMVKLDHSNAAYVEPDAPASADYVPTRTLTRDFFPPEVPPTPLIIEMKSGTSVSPSYEDPFSGVDFDSTDPLEGL